MLITVDPFHFPPVIIMDSFQLLRSVLEELKQDKDVTDNLLEVHLNGMF